LLLWASLGLSVPFILRGILNISFSEAIPTVDDNGEHYYLYKLVLLITGYILPIGLQGLSLIFVVI